MPVAKICLQCAVKKRIFVFCFLFYAFPHKISHEILTINVSSKSIQVNNFVGFGIFCVHVHVQVHSQVTIRNAKNFRILLYVHLI